MMIKVDDYEAMDLDYNQIDWYEFGSKNGNDTDLLCIVEPNTKMDCAFNNDHFFFHKDEEEKLDRLFCTPRFIVYSIINGASDLFYHMLFQKMFSTGKMQFLNKFPIEWYYSQKMFRSIHGIARRDLKQSKRQSDLKKIKFVDLYLSYLDQMARHFDIEIDYREMARKDALEAFHSHVKDIPLTMKAPMHEMLFDELGKLYINNQPERLDWVATSYYNAWKDTLL